MIGLYKNVVARGEPKLRAEGAAGSDEAIRPRTYPCAGGLECRCYGP
jgi:hypothetical protein